MLWSLLDSISIMLYIGHCVSHNVCRLNKVTAAKTSLALCKFHVKVLQLVTKAIANAVPVTVEEHVSNKMKMCNMNKLQQ